MNDGRSRSSSGDQLLKLPPNWYSLIVAEGVDSAKPGIYEWRIAGVGSYIGKFKRVRRPTREYALNVRRILSDRPYRKSDPDGLRRIHRELYNAHLNGTPITLWLLETVESEHINAREQELIAVHGSLNDPPFGRFPKPASVASGDLA